MTRVELKARVASAILRRMKPVFAWRGRIISRKFCEEPRWYDARARRACETVIDFLEMWEYGPALDRLDAIADEAAGIRVKLNALSEKYKKET